MPEPERNDLISQPRDRRWTIMVVPHGSEALRTWSVSERTLRGAKWGAIVMAVVLATGAGTLIRGAWRLSSSPAIAATLRPNDAPAGDVQALRSRVADLNNAMDTIRSAEARLRDVAQSESPRSDSVAKLLQARTDSLLRNASVVARNYGTLADSASKSARAHHRTGERGDGRAPR